MLSIASSESGQDSEALTEFSGQASSYLCFYSFSSSYSDPLDSFYGMTEDKKFVMRPKTLFPFKLPKIKFGVSHELAVPNISNPTGVERSVSFVVDKNTGKLDPNSVPDEFQELVQLLYRNISKPKTVMKIEDKTEDEVVRIRKGPSVQKGLKDEEIIKEMRSLVASGDPWDLYTYVRITIFCCFDHYQALLKQIPKSKYYYRGDF